MKFRLLNLVMFLFLTSVIINAQALTGTKLVGGTGADYATLTAAVTDINTKGVSGTLTLLINADLTEPGSIELTSTTLTGTNRLVIKPNIGKTPTVSFTTVATSGNKGNSGLAITGSVTNVGNITIDGSNTTNGTTKDMTFALNDGTNGRYVIRLNGDSDDITIKNLKIMPTAIMATTSSGTRTYGIVGLGTTVGAQDRLTVTNCEIGTPTSAFYYSLYKPDGGTFPYGSTFTFSKNTIYAQHKGLSIWGSDGNSSINDNTISVIGHPTGVYVQNSVNGIYAESWKGTLNIFNNKVTSLKAKAITQTSAKALYGILVYYASGSGNTGQTVNVYNNFISNFTYEGDATTTSSEVIGIAVDALDQTFNVFYNTIYMSNITTNPVYGIRVYDDAGMSADIKNNIVVNTVNQDNAYAIYVDPIVNKALKFSDYNNFVVTGANANVAYYNTAKYKTLADWKTISKLDANSISINPANPFGGAGQLKSLTDLHWVSKPAVTFAGTPITGFTTDIDGETRNTTKPYMGADEGPSLTSIKQESSAPTDFVLNQNYPNPFNPETVITFALSKDEKTSLVVFDVLGRKIATLVDQELQAGTYKATFYSKGLASGVYIYQLTAGNYTSTKQMILAK